MKALAVPTMMVPLVTLLLVAFIPHGLLALPSTVPAFLWSPNQDLVSNNGPDGTVNYQIISPKDLANSVMSQAGWSNLLCKGKEMQKPLDLALLFVGKELQSSDLSLNKHADPSLLELLKISFSRSNFSIAFPYVSASEEEKLENLLVSGFSKACGDNSEIGDVAFLGSCSLEGENHKANAAAHSIQDFLSKREEEGHKGATDLVVFCNRDFLPSENVDNTRSEGKILSEFLSSVEESGAKYSVLYVSDPSRSIQYPSYREIQRFLAESTSGNLSGNATHCDEVCQIKSSLLEGLLVGIVLLIILISGLCCMMGIDTPTRFEAPQES